MLPCVPEVTHHAVRKRYPFTDEPELRGFDGWPMKVRSPCLDKPQFLGKAPKPASLSGGVLGIIDLDPHESPMGEGGHKPLEVLSGQIQGPWMSQNRNPTGLEDKIDGLSDLKAIFIDIGRGPPGQITAKSLVDGSDVTSVDEQLREVRPADLPASGGLDNILVCDINPKTVQFFDNPGISLRPCLLEPGELCREYTFSGLDEVTEEVETAVCEIGTDLDTGDDLHRQMFSRLLGLVNAIDGVVIRDRDGLETFFPGQVDHLGGGHCTVGSGGVNVEVDFSHGVV